MESIFLSHTFAPHPDHKVINDGLVRMTRTMIEALNLRALDGMDLAGRAIDAEVTRRIQCSDALVALVMPHANAQGQIEPPPYVQAEFAQAKALGKQTIQVVHNALVVGGFGQGDEQIRFGPGGEFDAATKLLRSLSLWKRESGRPREIRLEPDELGPRIEGIGDGCCRYKLMVEYTESEWLPAKVWHEPGAVYAYLPSVPDASKVKLKLQLAGETWDSPFTNPMARVALARRQ